MKKLLILLCLAFSISASAIVDHFVAVDFGTKRHEALRSIKARFGEPNAEEDNSIVYYDKEWNGYRFTKIVFGFEQPSRGGYFNEARFFVAEPTRKAAVCQREALVTKLREKYSITHDYEENGNKFYKGGTSPEGIGFLFTVYTQKREGRWTTELRYGAFHKLKK